MAFSIDNETLAITVIIGAAALYYFTHEQQTETEVKKKRGPAGSTDGASSEGSGPDYWTATQVLLSLPAAPTATGDAMSFAAVKAAS